MVHGKGSKDCIVTLVERMTRFTLIGKLDSKTKEQTNARTLKLITPIAATFKTITSDNGTEFHGFEVIEKKASWNFTSPLLITHGSVEPTRIPMA